MRQISPLDQLIGVADNALRTLFGGYQVTDRQNPSYRMEDDKLEQKERKHSAGLMRINHCGEVCAQALYQGQAFTAKLPEVRAKMEEAAAEENDHLQWCSDRLNQLDSHTSIFNPLWYISSFSIGAVAGLMGDKWSLGFVKETEDQVVKHLDEHIEKISKNDASSLAILQQMKIDEAHHADIAVEAGAAKLPLPIRKILMPLMSKVMTKTSFII